MWRAPPSPASRVITTLYLLVNAAVLHVLPIGVLAHSNLAAADAARIVLGEGSSVIVTALAILCVATLANIQIMELTRTTYAMARQGSLPPRAGHASRKAARRAPRWWRAASPSPDHHRRRQREGPAL